jgi:hypothetical protein
MLEKILRRFVTEDTKVILAAIEAWTETELIMATRETEQMFDDYEAICPRLDKIVMGLVNRRVTLDRQRRGKRQRSLDTAAKVLMGEKFVTAAPMYQQHAAQQAMQNAAYNQLAAVQNTAYNQMATQQGLMSQNNAFGQSPYGQGNMISSTGTQR